MAEENDSSQEKTEEPTTRKQEKAREEGQIPRSRELTTTFILLAGTVGLLLFGPFMAGKLAGILKFNFTLDREVVFNTDAMIEHLSASLYQGTLSMMPVFALLLVASIAGPIGLGGWLFSSKSMAPKASRMNPLAGLKRMFALKALMELAKALGKVILIMAVAVGLLVVQQQDMLRLSDQEPLTAIKNSVWLSAVGAIALAAVTIAIAAIDIPFQIFENKKKLKMSRQEVKDEMKDTEGKPEVKSKIRQLQREMAQRRMMSEVPKADVVITNPTHYSVALKYDPDTMATPILVAKGADQTALKIREIARAHNIDIMESPALTRAIYHTTEIDQEVPADLYMAVAQVLAYVFQLRNFRKGRGEKPAYPRNIQVPRDMRFD
ncbi:flagellar biosynthesis protein FlhB [Marinimicrobium sp. C6131]|uniref:flagellar biosynthesis protein FlhB n=1 Tax=Marinimicrobium sp. C6131 TaxID=3022676 RepID=UPI00223E46CA|nr:flagellar biosynthesis protein FlhB [Marinimicrobium sp. C6131]UZJ45238.1 flagellar biosynthesis protein FlhB [Marinimicrobium sp. C6131]